MRALEIHSPGALSLIQDAGRTGLRRYGIPTSGAMDQFSYRVANMLVGNTPTAAAIEVTLMGLEIEALATVGVAITGADLGARINGQRAPLWTAIELRRGDRLVFRRRIKGCRAYLAVRGGVKATRYFDSCSVFLRGGMGAPLRKGDVISCRRGDAVAALTLGRSIAPWVVPSFEGVRRIRVILGPQHDCFTKRGIDTFLGSEYRLGAKSDRQGLRTEGPTIQIARGPDIISDPTPLGAVQVPGDGRPIILHRDGQSTGGYAKIAVTASADLDALGRLGPGDALQFEAVSVEAARAAAIEKWRVLELLAKALLDARR